MATGRRSGYPTHGEVLESLARHELESVSVPTSGCLRIVTVSDTHSHPHRDALDQIRAEEPDCILHAGDIGTYDVLDDLQAIAPLIAVRGNIDGHDGPPDRVTVELKQEDRLLARLLLFHIAVRGHRLTSDSVRLAKKYEAQIVVCGHSHVPLIATTDGVGVFNPGSMGPRRFGLPITFGVIEISPSGIAFRHIDCTTGAAWKPSGEPAI